MTNRSSNIEIARFIAALLIMAHHIFHLGNIETYPLKDCWIYVEFFLLITGFFTAKHFASPENHPNKPKVAIIYTAKKFMPILPYTLVVSVMAYITDATVGLVYQTIDMKNAIDSLGNFAFDILLIPDAQRFPLVTTLWYIFAMICVFPIFSCLVQVENSYLKMILFAFIPFMYYSIFLGGYLVV